MNQTETPTPGSDAPKRILVPLTLDHWADGRIAAVQAQARGLGAEIILLHVIPPAAPSTAELGEEVTSAQSQALAYLDAVAAGLRAEGVPAQPLVRQGKPAEVILEEIVAQGADVVVLGSNARRGLPRLLLGSVADVVIRRATCPVLVVRPDTDEPVRPQAVRGFAGAAGRAGPIAPHELGVRVVEVARIVGSVGRASELDERFRVRSSDKADRQRYERVRDAIEQGLALPPVVLYKLGYGYYVHDGHHRIAAALELGQQEIEAEVTEFVSLGDPGAQRLFVERRQFERTTGLTRIGAARVGNHRRIEELIRQYADRRDLPHLREAARVWEWEVYRPAARRIRLRRLAERFPGRRTADIFVELIDRRDRGSADPEDESGWDEMIDELGA